VLPIYYDNEITTNGLKRARSFYDHVVGGLAIIVHDGELRGAAVIFGINSPFTIATQ